MATLSTQRRMGAVLGGGFCGAISRYLLSGLIQGYLGKNWPYDILFINLTGALLLAFLTVLAEATFLVGPTRRLLLNVGFLGAYTTFSSLILGDILLASGGNLLAALAYLLLSIIGGGLAVFLGDALGQWFLTRARRSVPPKPRTTGRLTETLTTSLAGERARDSSTDRQERSQST
jgi:fluoride exporter